MKAEIIIKLEIEMDKEKIDSGIKLDTSNVYEMISNDTVKINNVSIVELNVEKFVTVASKLNITQEVLKEMVNRKA